LELRLELAPSWGYWFLRERNMNDDKFEWPSVPDRDWWIKTAMAVGGGEKLARFGAALFRGCSATQAARESGYGSTPASLKSEGYRIRKSNRCIQIIALAQAEASGTGVAPIMGREEAKVSISNLARSSDPALRLRAAESMLKLQDEERAQRLSNEDEGDPHTLPERNARTVLSLCPPERVPNLWCEWVLMMHHWHAPFLRDMAPYLNAHHGDHWDGAKTAYLRGEYGQMESDIARLERGEVLPLEDLLRKCGIETHTEKPRGNRSAAEPEEDHAAA
jgi:hypothetical protein